MSKQNVNDKKPNTSSSSYLLNCVFVLPSIIFLKKNILSHNNSEEFPLSRLPPGLASAIVAKFDDSFCHWKWNGSLFQLTYQQDPIGLQNYFLHFRVKEKSAKICDKGLNMKMLIL